MTSGTLETRLTAVEEELAQIKKRLEQNTVTQDAAPTTNPWLDVIFGAFKDDPLFDAAERYGREWRDSHRAEDEYTHVPA